MHPITSDISRSNATLGNYSQHKTWRTDEIELSMLPRLTLINNYMLCFKIHHVIVMLTVYFGAPSMYITLWFGFDYGTNPPLGTLII
jgi:hypothetical protein